MHRHLQSGLITAVVVLALVLAVLYWVVPAVGAHQGPPGQVLYGSTLTAAGGHTKIYISPTDAQWDAIDDPDWEVMMANYNSWYAANVQAKINANLDLFEWAQQGPEHYNHENIEGNWWWYHEHPGKAVRWMECRPGFTWVWWPDTPNSPETVVPDYCAEVYYDGYNMPQYGEWAYVSEVNWSGN